MQDTISQLRTIISEYSRKISNLSESDFAVKPLPNKWSKKEVVGHLVDSAQNNLRRFICGQYESAPPKIKYQQDFWVAANNYQQASQHDVITLWKLINEQIIAVLQRMPAEKYTNTCEMGNDQSQLRTLQWLAEDYVKHLKHHLNQVIPNSFDVTYP